MTAGSDIIIIILSIIFPPVGVALLTGCSCDLIINLLLTLFGYLPGTIHALWLVYRKMKAEERYGIGNVKYEGNGDWIARQTQHQYDAPPSYGATTQA